MSIDHRLDPPVVMISCSSKKKEQTLNQEAHRSANL